MNDVVRALSFNDRYVEPQVDPFRQLQFEEALRRYQLRPMPQKDMNALDAMASGRAWMVPPNANWVVGPNPNPPSGDLPLWWHQ